MLKKNQNLHRQILIEQGSNTCSTNVESERNFPLANSGEEFAKHEKNVLSKKFRIPISTLEAWTCAKSVSYSVCILNHVIYISF